MEQPGNQPIYGDSAKSALNVSLILALGIAVFGIATGQLVLLVLGLSVAGYNWFTNAKQYLIYTDALAIVYGRPRVKAYPFSEISHLEMLELPMGLRLRVRLNNGRRFVISTRNIEEFRDRLDEAMAKFNNTFQGQKLLGEEPDSSTPY
jgi:hypothetical protein